MKLTFFGGASEVGRNCIFLEDGESSVLLDCGIKLGEHEEYPLLGSEDFGRIKNIVISHTHMDHIGYLPFLYKKGCTAQIYATKPTRDLTQLLLSDYLRIHGKEDFDNNDISNVLKHYKIVEYDECVDIGKKLRILFHNAGHILGSAMISILGDKKVLYTGDINVRDTKILDGAKKSIEAEILIIESTYGGRGDIHKSLKENSSALCNSINATIAKEGKVLIPTFAVGRGQEILLILESYMRSGLLKKVPIYVDGMVLKANRIYRHNVFYAKEEIKRRILMSEEDPFKSKFFYSPQTMKKSDALSQPCIIVSTSGMLTGGPGLGYLKRLASNEKNKVILVGYQAEGTLGRKISEGERKVVIKGQEVDLKLEVEQYEFSAHSDHNGLRELIDSIKGLQKIFLIHGEGNKPYELAEEVGKRYEVIIPKNLETFNL